MSHIDKQSSMHHAVQGAPDSVRPTSISSMTRWQTCDVDFPCALGGGLYLKHLTSSGMSDSVCMICTSCADDITAGSAQVEQNRALVCAGLSELPRHLQAGRLHFMLQPQSICLHESQGRTASEVDKEDKLSRICCNVCQSL